MQSTSDTENRKQEISDQLEGAEIQYQKINKNLKAIEQKMITARENKARSGASRCILRQVTRLEARRRKCLFKGRGKLPSIMNIRTAF